MLARNPIVHPFRDELEADYLPDEWTPEHVERRLVEAYRTLAALPGGRHIKPREFGNSMPLHLVEWEDLLAQAENPDLEAITRRERPTAIQIANMDICLGWSLSFLRGYGDEARALSRRAGAKALGLSLTRVARRCEMNERQLRRMALRGAGVIAGGLNRRQDGVW